MQDLYELTRPHFAPKKGAPNREAAAVRRTAMRAKVRTKGIGHGEIDPKRVQLLDKPKPEVIEPSTVTLDELIRHFTKDWR